MKTKYRKYNWVKLQQDFNLYKLKNREKTLKDFCKLKGLNYNNASKKIKCKKSAKEVQLYDHIKNKVFTGKIAEKAIEEGKKQALTYLDKITKLDDIFETIYESIKKKISKNKDFDTLEDTVRAIATIVKAQNDLQRIEITKELKNESTNESEEQKEEDNFLKEILCVSTKKQI